MYGETLRGILLIDLGGSAINRRNLAMSKNNNVVPLTPPENPLEQLLKQGAQQLLASAIEAELTELLEQFFHDRLDDGRLRVVRNG